MAGKAHVPSIIREEIEAQLLRASERKFSDDVNEKSPMTEAKSGVELAQNTAPVPRGMAGPLEGAQGVQQDTPRA